MSDISPYGVTQNADAAHVTANQIVGDLLGSTTADALVGSSAALWSTAPYVPPERTGCYGKNKTCNAYPIKGTQWCVFHTPKDQGEPPAAP
jgi:hypothetical protein